MTNSKVKLFKIESAQNTACAFRSIRSSKINCEKVIIGNLFVNNQKSLENEKTV
jgi:hypothetical protein